MEVIDDDLGPAAIARKIRHPRAKIHVAPPIGAITDAIFCNGSLCYTLTYPKDDSKA